MEITAGAEDRLAGNPGANPAINPAVIPVVELVVVQVAENRVETIETPVPPGEGPLALAVVHLSDRQPSHSHSHSHRQYNLPVLYQWNRKIRDVFSFPGKPRT